MNPPPREVGIPGVGTLAWRVQAPASARLYDPEYVVTRGESRSEHPECYLLFSRVRSDVDRTVSVLTAAGQVPAMYLNGQRVGKGRLDLRAGTNEFLAVSYSGTNTYSAWHGGAWLRLVDPVTGQRVKGVEFVSEPTLNIQH